MHVSDDDGPNFYHYSESRDPVEMDDGDFESTVWWLIPGAKGFELGDCMEVRRPHPWTDGKYALVPVNHTPDGRPRVVIGPNCVHLSHVVASVIHGPRPEGELVRHLDDDVSNSYPSNLAYGSQKDNIADSLRNGTFPIGSRNGRARLNEEMVREIRRRGGGTTQLAREYGVDPKTIKNVLDGKLWKHVS